MHLTNINMPIFMVNLILQLDVASGLHFQISRPMASATTAQDVPFTVRAIIGGQDFTTIPRHVARGFIIASERLVLNRCWC